MKLVMILLLSLSANVLASKGGVGGSGGGGTKPTKDERTVSVNIDSGKHTVINLSDRFGSFVNSNIISENVSNQLNGKVDFSQRFVGDYKKITIKLNEIEEVTLIDGTVLSKEEILESIKLKD
jgi:hypothetical protein